MSVFPVSMGGSYPGNPKPNPTPVPVAAEKKAPRPLVAKQDQDG